MQPLVITISRQYGSGGRAIGETLAARLGVSYYDKVLLQLAAERSGLSPEFIAKTEEQTTPSFLFSLSAATVTGASFFYQYNIPVGDKAFFAQTAVIRELAAKESCVIVGRCADYVLTGHHERCLRVFLHAPLEARIARIAADYKLSEKEAKDRIHRIDKGRASYYRHYTGSVWGEAKSYDLCVSTAVPGVEGTVDTIAAMAKNL